MRKTIIYEKSRNRKNPFGAGKEQFEFYFFVVDSELIGTPEEQPAKKPYCITVTVSDVKAKIWKLDELSESDVEKVLFRFGSKYFREIVKTNSLPAEQQIEMPIITAYTHPDNGLPFELNLVNAPSGTVETVEIESPKIGYNRQ